MNISRRVEQAQGDVEMSGPAAQRDGIDTTPSAGAVQNTTAPKDEPAAPVEARKPEVPAQVIPPPKAKPRWRPTALGAVSQPSASSFNEGKKEWAKGDNNWWFCKGLKKNAEKIKNDD